jgi:uncharacterized protein YkwD
MRTILRSLLVSLVVVIAPTGSQAATAISYQAGSEQQVIALLNQIRRQNGLRSLALSTPLRAAARAHSADMLRNDYLGHDSASEAWNVRVGRYVRSSMIGETIARGRGSSGSAAGIVSQWMRSASHRSTILNAGFRFVGLGIAVGVAGGAPGSVAATADFST